MRKKTLVIFLFFASAVSAQQMPANYSKLVTDVTPKVVEWRRYFHEHPELSNREVNTGAYIASYLKSLGLEVKSPIARTGVVAVLKGGRPGPVVALRADIDALPVTERTPVPFASKVTESYGGQTVGVMHACGHDSHIAMLMGTATVLKQMQQQVPGTVVFLFQPAEEGGAPLMIKEGALDNPKVEAVFGLHIAASIPVGEIWYKSGAFMASSDWFTIKVKGRGAHGSAPWMGIDPITTAAQIIEGLQHIVSRESDITKAPVVVSVGAIHSGVRSNIIPETCEMIGTIRTLDSKMQKEVHERIKNTAEHIAASCGATAEVSIETKTLVTYNDPALVKKTLSSLVTAAGADKTKEMNWITGSEDFSYYGEKVPSFFFDLGALPKGKDPKTAPSHHTADFYIDESGFDVGVKAFCQLVFDYAKTK